MLDENGAPAAFQSELCQHMNSVSALCLESLTSVIVAAALADGSAIPRVGGTGFPEDIRGLARERNAAQDAQERRRLSKQLAPKCVNADGLAETESLSSL